MDNILFSTLDPRMFEVLLHRSRYINHIWPNHSLVEVAHILTVIEDPELVTQDVGSSNVENYYRQDVFEEYPDLYLKACVLFKPPEAGPHNHASPSFPYDIIDNRIGTQISTDHNRFFLKKL